MRAGELRVPGQDGPRLLGPRPPDGDHGAEAHGRRLRRRRALGLAGEREAALYGVHSTRAKLLCRNLAGLVRKTDRFIGPAQLLG